MRCIVRANIKISAAVSDLLHTFKKEFTDSRVIICLPPRHAQTHRQGTHDDVRMHVWSKVYGAFPARCQETKRSAFEAMCNNSNCFHKNRCFAVGRMLLSDAEAVHFELLDPVEERCALLTERPAPILISGKRNEQ